MYGKQFCYFLTFFIIIIIKIGKKQFCDKRFSLQNHFAQYGENLPQTNQLFRYGYVIFVIHYCAINVIVGTLQQ